MERKESLLGQHYSNCLQSSYIHSLSPTLVPLKTPSSWTHSKDVRSPSFNHLHCGQRQQQIHRQSHPIEIFPRPKASKNLKGGIFCDFFRVTGACWFYLIKFPMSPAGRWDKEGSQRKPAHVQVSCGAVEYFIFPHVCFATYEKKTGPVYGGGFKPL